MADVIDVDEQATNDQLFGRVGDIIVMREGGRVYILEEDAPHGITFLSPKIVDPTPYVDVVCNRTMKEMKLHNFGIDSLKLIDTSACELPVDFQHLQEYGPPTKKSKNGPPALVRQEAIS